MKTKRELLILIGCVIFSVVAYGVNASITMTDTRVDVVNGTVNATNMTAVRMTTTDFTCANCIDASDISGSIGACSNICADANTDTTCAGDGSCGLITYDSETAAWDKNESDDFYTNGSRAITGNLTVTGEYNNMSGLIICYNGTGTVMTRNVTLAQNLGCSI